MNGVSLFLHFVVFRPEPPRFGAATIEIFMNFGRADLRAGASKVKFDAEADCEVRSAVAPQKLTFLWICLFLGVQPAVFFFSGAMRGYLKIPAWPRPSPQVEKADTQSEAAG